MICPFCGKESVEAKESWVLSDNLNEFGRREIIIQTETIENIEWKDGLFHCNNCHKFTFQEGISQKKKIVDSQAKLLIQVKS
jgi:hypothetical protein